MITVIAFGWIKLNGELKIKLKNSFWQSSFKKCSNTTLFLTSQQYSSILIFSYTSNNVKVSKKRVSIAWQCGNIEELSGQIAALSSVAHAAPEQIN